MSALDPVQKAALDFARDKRGVAWVMEQGLGKTLTALQEFDALCQFTWANDGYAPPYRSPKADRMIVVCPNTFKLGWVDEMEKHGFTFPATVYESTSGKKAVVGRMMNMELHEPCVLIINYQAVWRPEVLKALCAWAKKGKTYLVIDESIQIKSPRAKQTKAIHRLALECAWVRCLTGRPQTQGPHDLWGQLRAIGLFANTGYLAFRDSFCVMGGYMMHAVVSARNEDVLAAMMKDNVFVAKKKDWLPELPRKDMTIRDYQMSGEQRKQYDSMEDNFLLYLAGNEGVVTVDVAIAKFEKLAQIQTGFIYGETGIVHELVEPDNNPRLNLLKEILLETEGKTCVVYRHKPIWEMLASELQFYNPAWIKGGMNPEDVEDQKARFNGDPNCRVILLQAEAAKYGHTLLGGPGADDLCRTMVFFENSYSADTRDQIEDRIHRRGQTGERVLYIDLSGSDLDRRITKALQRKDAMYTSVFKNMKNAEPVDG